jgi:hypothetical protein
MPDGSPRRSRRFLLSLALLLAAGAAAAVGVSRRFRGAADPCAGTASAIVVLTESHTLFLCDGGRATARFRVSIGSRGTDKRIQGDRRTPLGTYALGEPRASARFGTFIPIGYPTDEQQRRGLTGAAVGLHGPDRRLRWAGAANAWVDWTAGCVALPSDYAIAAVAAEVRRRSSPAITIR